MHVLGRKEESLRVKPESVEDLWHLSKVVSVGDKVTGSSTRKFRTEYGKEERKHVSVTLSVEKVEFHSHSGKLRVLGVIVAGKPEEFVQLNEHHSLDLSEGEVVTIEKARWRKHELDRLREAERTTARPAIGVLVLDEREAEFFTLREYGAESLGTVRCEGGGKYGKYADMQRKDLKNKWFTEILGLLKPGMKLVISGTGFERENFYQFLKQKNAELAHNSRVEGTNDCGKAGVKELLQRGIVDDIVRESRLSEETKAIERLVAELPRSPSRVACGLEKVRQAVEMGAASELLLLDSLLFERRADVEPVLDKAEEQGTKIFIVSHENEASKKLEGLGSVAVFLRFSIEAQ